MSTSRKSTRTLTSKKSSSSFPSKPKFLLRSLTISDQTELTFKQVCIKRVYLKNLHDKREKGKSNSETPYKPFKHNKTLKTLKNISTVSLSRSYAHESLKYSKRIKTFKLEANNDECQIDKIANTINKLPKTVRSIHLIVHDFHFKTDRAVLNKIARSIRKLPYLQHFHRQFAFDTEENKGNHVFGELLRYNNSALRLKEMKKIAFSLCSREQKHFQSYMSLPFKFVGINALEMYLTVEEFLYFELFQDFFEADESQDNIDNSFDSETWTPKERRFHRHWLKNLYGNNPGAESLSDDNIDEDSDVDTIASQPPSEVSDMDIPLQFRVKFLLRENIKPFYRFQNFPNLEKLRIVQENAMYPLSSFVINGFAELKKLEDFSLNIHERSAGSNFLFKGFLQLPLLRVFSLGITFIKNEEWPLLEQFMKVQRNLETFNLMIRDRTSTRDRYLAQNTSLGNILRDLQNKPRLKTLRLQLEFCSLETISKALGDLTLTNQLEEFHLAASDDTVTSKEKLWKRVEGLCSFLKNQKGSLKTLFMILPCVLEDNIVTHIAEAISKLANLRELWFSVNSGGNTHDLIKYFEGVIQGEVPVHEQRKLAMSKTWNPNLAKYFKRLENLEHLSFRFDRLDIAGQKEQKRWFLDVIKMLPDLERLRKVLIQSDSGDKFWDVENKMSAAVLELRNVREVDVYLFDQVNLNLPHYPALTRAVQTVNQRQSMRCDLMF